MTGTMWLINTCTLQLEFVPKAGSQPYAILSHTWEDEEVTFQEMANLEEAWKEKGFVKIKKTCELARRRDPPPLYAWVDTCCIDKKSSAELAEAINSMFAWYKKATVCFAFLSDLLAHKPVHPDPELPGCRWFTRGWALQELIAPEVVEFYDSEWHYHGTKSERREEIASITGVDVTVLRDSSSLHTISNGLRKGYWTVFNMAVAGEKLDPDDKDIPMMISPPHIRHCVDLLRLALMCQPDLTVEVKDDEAGGVHGFGETHQCIDWTNLTEWTTRWESWKRPTPLP
ncbi:hypothetical protein VMCG_01226 [Cytospora schulzeri]|uniref:Heterokaryon incompatibility domain-containing protein n=1 Tax=Cytospora schulzeri TaxID=448051 RepID=A0A423X5T4_9PEZI|nr:hypothetical protein VMCG_01226 [Valsa malicola]